MPRPSRAAPLTLAATLAALGAAMPAGAQPAPASEELTPGARALLAGEDPSLSAASLALGEPSGKDLAGQPIRRVTVVTVGGRWGAPLTITDAAAQPGKPASAEAARRILREALATGRYARANVEAIAEAGGITLRLNVLPRRLIASVQIQGGALETAETLQAAEVAVGGELTFPQLATIEARLRELYQKRGFPLAEVRVDAGDTDQPDKVVLSIDVKPGAPRTISWRGFVVEPAVDRITGVTRSTPTFEREVGNLTADYKVALGARLDDAALADADKELGLLLRQHGFFKADVRHKVTASGPSTFLFVYVFAGPRFVPAFEGHKAFDATELEDALNLEKAPEARPVELVERLRAFYVSRGFLDAEVNVAERSLPDAPVHTLAFTVREHGQVRVVRRIYPCLDGDEITPDFIGGEIDSYLEEDIPAGDSFGPVNARTISHLFGPTGRIGGRGEPTNVYPRIIYAPETYERAMKHIRDVLHGKGYLNAVVGPTEVVRAECQKRSPEGLCFPIPPRNPVKARCEKDPAGLPLSEPKLSAEHTCRPDPAKNRVCSPEMTLRLPVALGPRTTLYDLAFDGNHAFDSRKLADIVARPGDDKVQGEIRGLGLGDPLSSVEMEAARLRIQDRYRVEGFAYADVRADQEPSPDRTRARLRFSINERERVTVSGFVVRGASRTSEALILARLELKAGKEYREDLKRKSEESVMRLGTFSSVSLALEDSENPQKQKRVVVTVAEMPSQFLEQRPGFSTGDGLRYTFEYGHRNLGGLAISASIRIQLSYLPDALILDSAVLANYTKLSVVERLERRDTLSVTFHDIGLGAPFALTLEAIDLNDNQRDYGITKEAFVPTLTYRPSKRIILQLGASVELNDVTIFTDVNTQSTSDLIRAPAGRTVAFSQRVGFTADYRDNPLNARRGVLFSTNVEHVDALPVGDNATVPSHFFRLSGRAAGYYTLGGATLVASLAAGGNIQLTGNSETYPDRLFFLGGVDTNRAFLADSVVPQDVANKFLHPRPPPTGPSLPNTGLPLGQRTGTIQDVDLRGGDLSINPRLDLRVPLPFMKPLQVGVFLDMGNLWLDPTQIRLDDKFMRVGLGPGLRYPTPIGPIAVDYGFNMNRRFWEDVGAFHFSIGLF